MLCCAAAPAAAAEGPEPSYDETPATGAWSRTFSTLTDSCLAPLPPAPTIIGTGEDCPLANAAAAALSLAVPGSSRLEPRPADDGGGACALYDHELVAQTKGPAVIIRRLPQAEPGPARVAVTVYENGRPRTAVVAVEGAPLASCADVRRVERELHQKALRVEEPDLQRKGPAKVYEGTSTVPVDPGRLFELTGRQDLLARYRYENHAKLGWALAGLGIAIGGVALVLADPWSCAPDGACEPSGVAIFGTLAAVTGIVVLGAAAASDADPTDDEEKRKLVEEYNARLREQISGKLGLSAAPRRWNVAAAVGPSGGGLTLRMRF